jgi:NitT/TauT family transport system substrate-binding protein
VYDSGGITSIVAAPGMASPADLKGKRVGVAMGSSSEIVISDALNRAGLFLRDVTLIDVPVADVPSRLGVDIDAGVTYQPYTSEALRAGNQVLTSSEISSLLPDIILFYGQTVDERPEDVRAFLKAWFEAAEFRRSEPRESLSIISKWIGKPTHEIVMGDAKLLGLRENRALFTEQGTGEGNSIYTIAQINLDFMLRAGSLTYLINIRDLFDPGYLPQEGTTFLDNSWLALRR